MGCIKFVYTEHKYKYSEPFCSRSQYGETRILFFLLLRLWINSFGFTMGMKLLNSPFCVASIVFYEFRKVKFRIFRKFSHWQIVQSETVKMNRIVSNCQDFSMSGKMSRLLFCLVQSSFQYYRQKSLCLPTDVITFIHSSLKSKIQSQKDAQMGKI